MVDSVGAIAVDDGDGEEHKGGVCQESQLLSVSCCLVARLDWLPRVHVVVIQTRLTCRWRVPYLDASARLCWELGTSPFREAGYLYQISINCAAAPTSKFAATPDPQIRVSSRFEELLAFVVMAPTKAATAPYAKDEKVLCFHHEMLYEAKVLETRPTEDGTSWQYRIHYKGWKNT